MRNGTDPLLIDLAARECINLECRCGRVVQLAAFFVPGRNDLRRWQVSF
ncbi:MAG TPA: hypothetical protein VFS85_11650 [Dongiaceae bacterium]|nr:hypothetical protein [Dongiaceae bacterium]